MSVPTAVAAKHDRNLLRNDNCLINELVKQIILYRRQNDLFFSALRWPALACVFDSVLA